MPELPEVETIRLRLLHDSAESPSVAGRAIQGVQVLWEGVVDRPDPETFQQKLVGQEIVHIGRRGKFFIFELSEDWLLIHLRMSGDLLLRTAVDEPAKHDRLILDLEGGLRMAFNDTRKFGRVYLVSDPQEVVADLGPEPLDEGFSPHEFYAMLQSRSRLLKPLLLDQRFIAGLGNIYVNEALYRAKLHPMRISDSLSKDESTRLLAAIREALLQGIQHKGASIDWVYRGGGFQDYFHVHDRAGEPCPTCGETIWRILVGQRSTFYCPGCQRLPEE